MMPNDHPQPKPSPPSPAAPSAGSVEEKASIRPGRIVLAVLLLLFLSTGLGLMAGVSWNRAFQVDEVEHLHAAYHLASGRTLYTEFWQPHNPLLYWMLAPLTTPTSPYDTYRAGRGMMLAFLLATVALCALAGGLLGGRRRRLEARSARIETDGNLTATARHQETGAGSLPLGQRRMGLLDGRAALVAGGLALFHTTLVERGMEVRPDGLLGLVVSAALAIEVLGWKKERLRHSLCGILLGIGFLATQKAVFASFAFGCLWLVRAIRHRCPGRVLWPVAAWGAPLAAATLVLVAGGNFQAYLELNILDALDTVSGAEHRSPFGPTSHLLRESSRNGMFVLLVLYGLFHGLRALARGSTAYFRRPVVDGNRHPGTESPFSEGLLAFPGFLATLSLLSLWANPFPWPYVHVSVVPPLAVLAGATLASKLESDRRDAGRAPAKPNLFVRQPNLIVVSVLLLCALGSAPRLISKALPITGQGGQDYQFQLLDEIQRITAPDDAVFDLVGLYFRPDGYRAYALSGDLFGWYRRGGLPPMVEELVRNETVAVIFNYRTQWLDEERQLIAESFTHYFGNLFVLGRDLSTAPASTPISFRVLKTKPFRYDGPGTLTVGGRPFRKGVLEKGVHILQHEWPPAPPMQAPRSTARLIMDTPAPRPATLAPGPLYINFD